MTRLQTRHAIAASLPATLVADIRAAFGYLLIFGAMIGAVMAIRGVPIQ
jgi:hypothetical protein